MTGLGKIYNSKGFKYCILALWLAIILLCLINSDKISIDSIINFVPKNKVLAAIIMMLLFALKSISVFIYSGIIFAALGVMFDLPVALFLAVCGSFIIAVVPYYLGRKIGEGQIDVIERKYPKLNIVKELRTANDFLFVLLLRMIEFVPYDVSSIYMGAAEVNFKKYLIASVIGMMQVAVPMTLMGYSAEDTSSPLFIASLCIQIGITVISIIIAVLFTRNTMNSKKKTQQ